MQHRRFLVLFFSFPLLWISASRPATQAEHPLQSTPLGVESTAPVRGETAAPDGSAVALNWPEFWECWWAQGRQGDESPPTEGCWGAPKPTC